jgi:hypothetical protein
MEMPEVDRDPVATFRHRLDHLRAEGRELGSALAGLQDSAGNLEPLRVWQRECAATISQLSGGSKAHWLSRAFSEALLVPNAGAGAAVVTIIERLLAVLDSATQSLAAATVPASDATAPPPQRPRFTFVPDLTLRSQLESAYLDGQQAFGRGEFVVALVTSCSILETVITDALERRGSDTLSAHDPPREPIVEWPFGTRIAIAERAGIISRGCARLPGVAREYRALLDAQGDTAADTFVSPRDAKLASDVLHVILRDLAPGR